jgi:hypothetical protein
MFTRPCTLVFVAGLLIGQPALAQSPPGTKGAACEQMTEQNVNALIGALTAILTEMQSGPVRLPLAEQAISNAVAGWQQLKTAAAARNVNFFIPGATWAAGANRPSGSMTLGVMTNYFPNTVAYVIEGVWRYANHAGLPPPARDPHQVRRIADAAKIYITSAEEFFYQAAQCHA